MADAAAGGDKLSFYKHNAREIKFVLASILLFFLPLFTFFLWVTHDESFWSPPGFCPKTGTRPWYCADGKQTYAAMYHFGVWPPTCFVLGLGNYYFYTRM